MSALRNVLAGGVVAAALIGAAPASAQVFPGYGGGYGGYGYGGGDVVGQVIGQVIAGSMGGYGGYSPYGGYGGYGGNYGYGYGNQGINSQAAVSQCMGAVQTRLNGGRVLGVSRVEQRNGGGLNIRGVANSGRAGAYAYTYGAQAPVDLTFTCRTDFRGMITDVDIDRAQSNYGYNNSTPYNGSTYGNNYSNYGYSRY